MSEETPNTSSPAAAPEPDSFQQSIARHESDRESFTEKKEAVPEHKPLKRIESHEPKSDDGLLNLIEPNVSVHTEQSKENFKAARAAHVLDRFSPEAVAKCASKFDLTTDDLKSAKYASLVANALENQQKLSRLKGNQDAEESEGSEGEENESEEAAKEDSEKEDPDFEDAKLAAKEQPQDGEVPQFRNAEEAWQYQADQLLAAVRNPEINSPMAMDAAKMLVADCLGANSPESLATAERLTEGLTGLGMNLVSTIAPMVIRQQLNQMLEEIAPGLVEAHKETMHRNSWADVLASSPDFRSLPQELGSPEWHQMLNDVCAHNGWLDNLRFDHLPYRDALRMRQEVLCRLATGQKVSPESISKAVETGRKEALAQTRKVTAGRLGGGKRASSMGNFSQKDDDAAFHDDFRSRILAHNRAQRSND